MIGAVTAHCARTAATSEEPLMKPTICQTYRFLATLCAITAVSACDSEQPSAPAAIRTPSVLAASIGASSDRAPVITANVGAQVNVGAAAQCPPQRFVNNVNLAANPSFEFGAPLGFLVTFPPGPVPTPSAAASWFMHTDNINSRVSTREIPTTVPGVGGGLRMLHISASSLESGVYQLVPNSPRRVMFSVWVKVLAGQVAIGANAMMGQTPNAFSTKVGEWEQLRVCTDGTWPTDMFYIYNVAPAGGQFYVDRVEIRQTP
jgi:hypothetical protein